MTQHNKIGSVCTCRSGPYQPNVRGGKVCVCGASAIATVQPLQRQQHLEQPIPTMNYHHGNAKV